MARVTMEMDGQVENIARQVLEGQPYGGIIRVEEFRPVLGQMIPFTLYEGVGWFATRKQVDYLDQVTFERKRS